MDECKHGMNPEWCFDCKSMKALGFPEGSLAVRRFTARYPGRCAINRDHAIEPGDEIGVSEHDEYLCEECCDDV